MAENQIMAIAIPPPLGVGLTCELLSFGRSRIVLFTANHLYIETLMTEIKNIRTYQRLIFMLGIKY